MLSALSGSTGPASTLEVTEVFSEGSCLSSLEVGRDPGTGHVLLRRTKGARMPPCCAKPREEDTGDTKRRLSL